VAVADPVAAARAAIEAIVPGIETHETPEALLATARPDVVHVCTPPPTHAAMARLVLEAGAHVYVEKPFTPTAAEATAILELAAARGLKVCAGHQLLYEPPTAILRQYLPALGPVTHIESYFAFRPVRHLVGGRAALRPDHQLLDILPHPVYLLLNFLEMVSAGPVELVSLRVSRGGTVHALVRQGDVTGTLVVTLEGRPVESYLRIVGRNGLLFADYVRSTVQRTIGPGTSGLDKLAAPYQQAWQLLFGTTGALGRRFLKKQRSYPGLAELFQAFYGAIRTGAPSPLSPESILGTVRISEQVAAVLERAEAEVLAAAKPLPLTGQGVVITGGTGVLGVETVRALMARGRAVRVLARRAPPSWNRDLRVDYTIADVAAQVPAAAFAGADTVIHAAAETAGGWDEHQRNSLDATEQMVRAAAAAGVRRFIHVSSIAVLAKHGGRPLADEDPLEPDSRGSGPYVWGKLESELLAIRLGPELGIDVKVVRPGALVDYRNLDPPGRLGKRLGSFFVAVGSPGQRLGVVDVGFAGRILAWMVDHWDEAPARLNLLDPELPAKRDLLATLRRTNPDLKVIWLPTFVLVPLSWGALLLQKVRKPGRPAIDVAKVFSVQAYDTSRSAGLAARLAREERTSAPPPAPPPPAQAPSPPPPPAGL
jgi:predicted dehydrogenase/nucleoside-diphosphate-sugar epimerase